MFQRAIRTLLAITMLTTTLVVAGTIDRIAEPITGEAPRAEALSFVNILFDRPGATATFGPNELVEIMAGNINYIGGRTRVFGGSETLPACTINAAGTGAREHPGLDDKLQPFADIYIVPSGQQPTNDEELVDVNGAPNTVFGGLGGSFLFEPLGVTFPTGKISAGVYGLVIDECQNGYFDTGEDSYIDDAFWVDLDQDVPPLSPATAQFLELKKSAASLQNSMDGIKYLLKFQAVLEQAKKLQDVGLAVASPETFSVFMINQAVGYFADNSPYGVAKKDLKETMQLVVTQHLNRLARIAADPPQTNYQRPAVPISAGAYFEDSSDPLTEAMARYMAHQDAVSAMSGALLDAIERYQGADQTGDAQWALRHARTIEELTPIYNGLLAGSTTATTALTTALATIAGTQTDSLRFTFMNRYAQQAIDGLNAERNFFVAPDLALQSEVLNTDGDPEFARAVRERWVANTSTAAPTAPEQPGQWITVIENAKAATAQYSTAFDGFDVLATANIGLLETELGDLDQDPLLDISVTGTPAAGAALSLSVGPIDPGTIYDWDLDADGEFDDATGPSAAWTVPGDAMVGVPLMVSVRGRNGSRLDSAIEVVTVATGGNIAPSIVSRTVNGGQVRIVETGPGVATALAVVASDAIRSAHLHVEGQRRDRARRDVCRRTRSRRRATASARSTSTSTCPTARRPPPRRSSSGHEGLISTATGTWAARSGPTVSMTLRASRQRSTRRPGCTLALSSAATPTTTTVTASPTTCSPARRPRRTPALPTAREQSSPPSHRRAPRCGSAPIAGTTRTGPLPGTRSSSPWTGVMVRRSTPRR